MGTMQQSQNSKVILKSKQENFFSNILADLVSCHLNIKNCGNSSNRIDVESKKHMTISEESWFTDEHGVGKTIIGNSMHNEILITAKNDGVLKFCFRGPVKYFDNQRLPIWLDFSSIKIDSKEMLKDTLSVSFDKPKFFEVPVVDGQQIKLDISQEFHEYSKDDMIDLLKKMYPTFEEPEKFYNFYSKKDNLVKVEYSWPYVKKYFLTQKPKCINYENISIDTYGRLQISIGNTKFESVYIPNTGKKLYVVLSAVGNKDTEYPKFARVSWCDKFNGNYICFDDPTRYEKNIAPAFFFGTKTESYLYHLQLIIKKIALINNIPNENITFISSSNGGFASLWLADKILGSKCIALCPQVDVIQYRNKWFVREIGLENEIELYSERLRVINITENKKSKFFIFSNIMCREDKTQMELLYKEVGHKFEIGFVQLAPNVKCLLAEIDAPDPHLAQPDAEFVKFIENNMDYTITPDFNIKINYYLNKMKELYQ